MFGSRYIYYESLTYRVGVSDEEIPISQDDGETMSYHERGFLGMCRDVVQEIFKTILYCTGVFCVCLLICNVILFLIFYLFKNWDNVRMIFAKLSLVGMVL